MQNTTTNIATGNTSSVKQQKQENVLPRLRLEKSSAYKPAAKGISLMQRIIHFFRTLFARKAAVVAVPIHTDIQQGYLVQSKPVERQSLPLTQEEMNMPAVMCAGTRTDAHMRRIAEQQFANMDITQATMN